MPIEIPVQPIAREVERRPASTEERIGHGEHTRHRHLQLRHHLLRGGHGEVTVAKEQHAGVVRSEMQYENWCMLACITKESVQADRRGAVGGGVIRGGHAAQHGPQRPRQQVPGAALCGAVGHGGECGRGPRAERLDHGSAGPGASLAPSCAEQPGELAAGVEPRELPGGTAACWAAAVAPPSAPATRAAATHEDRCPAWAVRRRWATTAAQR
ncbi:unnamed protein product [Miscanthus lutarioriparius]|uniref:Uncharacterized protein n=1 Tax=Miscanthus lutarioriparius TaxID=422564 RepID=A0A811MBI8_9POAL|nr:unnamed protein product [Miscanthus lutarioriparius]